STHLSRYEGEWWKVIAIWEGGIALFGGLTFGALAMWWSTRRYGVRMGDFLDALAPGLPLAQAIGRWGNYFNQELFGTPTDLPWGLEIDPARR
ncbi:MAG: prolipoprotein diacylglyceryl transferase, partial [Actinobacteria bacterium]|nr:prolipoprotein diacylglyceryl transferase [Actinomycetota bacterium]NIS37409.1 prolipoprotein diacylglyceryl transferase [Actinomycetota bacterium]NIT99351.1 prolipoprotein diacylglyceryl transferase [Actinomycetota bacterium]NIU22943.1 prolipoprotein diacylglyceryl transferase [Actinomycetota bacterium]NIU71979.1 prolipoprotein diacylglyceryl transferase [Actinomycetota bacterium]